jgi:hypothetical protein
MPATPEQLAALAAIIRAKENRVCPHGPLIVEGMKLRCEPHYDESAYHAEDPALDTQYQREEDEYAAREVLGRLVLYLYPTVPEQWQDRDFVKTWQAYLMFLYKPIAKHYNVDADALLSSFNRHYLPSIIMREYGEAEAVKFMMGAKQ